MWFFPLVATVVSGLFAGVLVRRSLSRLRPHEVAWAIALAMYAGGSFALFLGAVDGWSAGEYRWYWLLGAVLNVPYLAHGELLLLVKDARVRAASLLLLLFATAYAANRVRTAGLDPAGLGEDLPLGREVWAPDDGARQLAQIFAYPTYTLLVLGAIWSAWRMRRSPEARDRFRGTLLVAVGATVVAAGSAFAAEGLLPGFSISLTAGIALMFWGFLLASRSRPAGSA